MTGRQAIKMLKIRDCRQNRRCTYGNYRKRFWTGAKATRELLKYYEPLDIVETVIIPALEKVGREYETGEKFLPQLVQSADAVKHAFQVLKEQMSAGGETISYGRILLATVKGDIHDIGKNIVKVLLENYGYEVLDLGKDTDIQLISTRLRKIQLVGLSVLMTTP